MRNEAGLPHGGMNRKPPEPTPPEASGEPEAPNFLKEAAVFLRSQANKRADPRINAMAQAVEAATPPEGTEREAVAWRFRLMSNGEPLTKWLFQEDGYDPEDAAKITSLGHEVELLFTHPPVEPEEPIEFIEAVEGAIREWWTMDDNSDEALVKLIVEATHPAALAQPTEKPERCDVGQACGLPKDHDGDCNVDLMRALTDSLGTDV